MQVKSVLTLATGLFAPAAMSFLIPPEMGLDDTEPLALDISWGPPRQTIDLGCPGCTIRVGDIVSMSAKNHLQLTFSVEGDETNGNRLVVNGFELYPDPNPWEGGLTAMQQLDVSLKDLGDFEEDTQPENAMDDYSVEVPVGYTLAVYNGPSDVTQQMRLVNVDLTITEVAGDRVDGLPTLKVQLINQNGLLYIATIAKVQNTSGGQQEDCQDMWCMAKNMLDKSFGKLKSGCKGMMAHHGDGHRRPHHGFHGHEHGGKGHMHHGHHMPEERPAMPHHESHSVLGMMANLLEHFILPLLVGIMAGVAVGSVAMLVVSYIVRFFLYVSGKQTTASRCPFQRRRAEDVEVIIVEEEKAGLMENQEDGEVQDAPPKYSDDGTPRV